MSIFPTRQQLYGGYGTTISPVYNSPGSLTPYKVEVPPPFVELNKTLQYEFRVLESVKNGQVVNVGLQVSTYEIDHYGARILLQGWTDVERVRLEI